MICTKYSGVDKRYKKHIQYIISSNPQSAYTCHILHSKDEYRTMNTIMSLHHPVHKSEWISSLENFCIHFFQQCNSVINKQSQKVVKPSLISSMVYNSIMHVHDPQSTPLPFIVWFQGLSDLQRQHYSVAYQGEGFGVFKPPLPRNSEGPPKSCQTQPNCENC